MVAVVVEEAKEATMYPVATTEEEGDTTETTTLEVMASSNSITEVEEVEEAMKIIAEITNGEISIGNQSTLTL